MATCHPEGSTHFSCTCGANNEWLHSVTTQACLKCQLVHARGADGPEEEPEACKGAGKRIKFTEAAWRAHEEFLRMMYRCGFDTNRNGKVFMTSHNVKRSKYKGFTLSITEHFAGDGDL